MHVVATAGHVDHGKSTLVRRLTGMEPDRWDEELRRGLTIDLGFGWTRLPSGADVAFVDVPGHERFVANMLTGVGPVPAVMVVVAADEGWMPQSAEHLAAIDALGVRHGLLVVTRSDLADPTPAMARAHDEIARTSLGDIEAVCVSGQTGAGVDDLRAALDRLVTALPAPDVDAPVRLWVDRAFTIAGSGTVVTGTLPAGTLRVGDTLQVGPAGQRVRVRGLESLKRRADTVPAVARVALNLRGVPRDTVHRGDALLTPDAWLAVDEVDVRLARSAADDLAQQVTLHVGAAAVQARTRPLGKDATRLVLRTPLPLRIGDRALLRDPGSRRVVGVVVLDVRPPSLRGRGRAAGRSRELDQMDGRADGAGEVRRRGAVRTGELRAMGADPPFPPVAGDWLVDPDYAEAQRARLGQVVAAYNAERPLEPGMPVEAVRRVLGLPDPRLVEALIAGEGHDGRLAVRGGRVGLVAAEPSLPPDVESALGRLRDELVEEPFAAPDANRLAELRLGPRELAAAVRLGRLVRVAEGVHLLPGVEDQAAEVLAGLEAPFTTSEARRALGTSRRVAIPLLEHLDRLGVTKRLPDDRRRLASDAAPSSMAETGR